MPTFNGNNLANVIVGSPFNDTLNGFGGNDILDGRLGADTMHGGTGNDTYFVDNIGDVVDELAGQGTDRVISSISFRLDIGTRINVENLTLTGTAATGIGNSLNNTIFGNAVANSLIGLAGNDHLSGLGGSDSLLGGSGNDTLNGGTGADTMRGGADNDTYFIDNTGDVVIELTGAGIDRIVSLINTSLNITGRLAVENLTLGGTAIQGVGNALNNVIIGNSSANVLVGAGGNDQLFGGAGGDFLGGGPGNDTITTGSGADNVVFSSALSAATNVDHILDFAPASDTIRLLNNIFTGLPVGVLDIDAFDTGTSATFQSDRIIYDPVSGALFFDPDGSDAGSAQVQFATLAPNLDLENVDFFVAAPDVAV